MEMEDSKRSGGGASVTTRSGGVVYGRFRFGFNGGGSKFQVKTPPPLLWCMSKPHL